MSFILALLITLYSDVEITSTLPAHSQRTESVAVDNGAWGIEVFANGDKLSCTYSHLGDQPIVQENVSRCYATTNTTFPAFVSVNVVNNSDRPLLYKVRGYSLMGIKKVVK